MSNVAGIERFLSPISEASPSGPWLRYDGTYDRVREARREDDPSLPQGVWQTALKVADWKGVIAICEDALEKKAKDLQVAVWLAEAWLTTRGFAGAVDGLRLVAALTSTFWADIHPRLAEDATDDGERAEARIALYEWLDETFSSKLRQTPFASVKRDARSYTLADWEAGVEPPKPGQADGVDDERDKQPLTLELFLQRAGLDSPTIWSELRKNASGVLAAAEDLELTLAEHLGASAPTLRRTRNVARSLLVVVTDALRLTGGEPPPAVDADEPAHDGEIAAAPALQFSSGRPIKSRAEAYAALNAAADYLLRTEPHSPVPYLVKRAVSWGNMSLAELLFEFIGNTDDIAAIQRLLGMRGVNE